MSSSLPTTPAASGCCRSRFRWHSGHGVTRQSASPSMASPRWRPACLREACLFIVMIGKPQHLRMPAYSITVPPSASITWSRWWSRGGAGGDGVAAVEGAPLEVGEGALDQRAEVLQADLLHQQPQEVLVRQT